jgi:hypothetical protein
MYPAGDWPRKITFNMDQIIWYLETAYGDVYARQVHYS